MKQEITPSEREITPSEQEVTPVFKPECLQHIKAAKEHANPKWLEAALKVVKKLAKKRETLTTADVLTELEKSEVKTHDLRAVGPVMVLAKKLGWIESGSLVRRNDAHTRGATTLWKSLLYKPASKKVTPEADIPSTDIANAA